MANTSVATKLARVVRSMRTLIDNRLRPLGVTLSHWYVLSTLSNLTTPLTQKQLADVIGITCPSLVGLLDLLEEKNLISRTEVENDRRSKHVQLTESTKPMLIKIEKIIVSTRQECLNGVTKEEEQSLFIILNKIEKNITVAH